MYTKLSPTQVLRQADGAIIPASEENADYRAFLAWVEEGNTPDELLVSPVEPNPVPAAVTARQARLALLQAGRYDEIGPAIEAMPEPQRAAARIEWEFAATVERGSPLVATLADALDLTDVELDALFVAAGAL